MNKPFLTLSVAALALTGTAALAQFGGPMPKPDANGDGSITRAEMHAHGNAMFAKMDVNGDGVINDADRALQRQKMFAEADSNGDGELSPAEMQAMRAKRKERREEHRADRAGGREGRAAKVFERLDTDKSGGLSQAELAAAHDAMGKRGKRGEGRRGMRGGHGGGGPQKMLRLADANGDKTVTRAEFDKALAARFAKMDTNGDGTISAAEHEAARKSMRGERKPRGGE